ncbi:MAG: hypothetical protein R3E31_01300 [Chloroflexota bacterium]|nr:hypothetical protein [Anaerolineales bacterium]MCA9976459.1 hypothetical protein [Anaerolineales bacterium]MCB8968849.1 hypothetical protein [Ardenticatenaceae bacterium]
MPTKIIMRWDVRKETESEYFEFLVHEFIPGLNRLGIGDIQVWYTAYGDCEQKLASGVTQSTEQMRQILDSSDWLKLTEQLQRFVNDYSQKMIPATRGFQL